jgi:hypothetical protein
MEAALVLLLGLWGGQQDAIAPPPPRPAFTLVVARGVASVQSGIPLDCPEGVICVDTLSFASFDQAQSLYGPDLGPKFGAGMAVHMRLRGEPMLLVVASLGDERRVIAWGRGGGLDQMACVRREEIPDGWKPQAVGLFSRSTPMGDELCASVAGIKQDVTPVDPITVISVSSASELERMLREKPHKGRKTKSAQ